MSGTAKKSTETSIETMSSGRQSTARAVHSRRPARVPESGCVMVILPLICVGHIVFMRTQKDTPASAYQASSWLDRPMTDLPRYLQLALGSRARRVAAARNPAAASRRSGARRSTSRIGTGVDAMSMKSVATAVGFTTMSLYRYVDSKDELHAVMVDFAYGPPDLRVTAPTRAGGPGSPRGPARSPHAGSPTRGPPRSPGRTTADPQHDRLDGVGPRGARGRPPDEPAAARPPCSPSTAGARTTSARRARWASPALSTPTGPGRLPRHIGALIDPHASRTSPRAGPEALETTTRTSSTRSSTTAWAASSTASRPSSPG